MAEERAAEPTYESGSFDFWLIIYASIYITIFLVGLISNFLILGVFVFKKEFHSLPNLFFLNLCVADLLVLFFCMPVTIADLFSPNVWYLGGVICRLYTFLEYLATSVSSFTVITISIERFVAVTRPFQVRSLFNKKNSTVILLLIWFTGVAISIPFLNVSSYHTEPITQCMLDFNKTYIIYVMVLYILLIFIPIVVLSVVYIYIIYKLRFYRKTPEHMRSKSIRSEGGASLNLKKENSSAENRPLRLSPISGKSEATTSSIKKGSPLQCSTVKSQRFKNAIKISLIGWAFFCCQVPVRTFLLWSYYHHHNFPPYIDLDTNTTNSTSSSHENIFHQPIFENYALTDLVARACTVIYYLHCVSNSVIYNISSTKFRNAFLKMSGIKRK